MKELLLLISTLTLTTHPLWSQNPEHRVFTTRDGATYESTAFYMIGDQIYLRLKEQRPVELSYDELSPMDKDFLREWTTAVESPKNEPGEVDLDSDLILALYFAGDTKDSSGLENHGVTHGIQKATDRFGRESHAVAFSGLSQDAGEKKGSYIEIPEPNEFDYNAPYTFSVWFNRNDAGSVGGILGRWGYGGLSGDNFSLGIEARQSRQGKIAFTFPVPGLVTLYSESVCAPKLWTHAAVTYDGYNAKLFINGELEDAATFTLSSEIRFSQPIKLGVEEIFYNHRTFFEGKIDDVLVYSRALNLAEVTALSQQTKGGDISALNPKHEEPMRTWASKNGRTIEARLISATPSGEVQLKDVNNRTSRTNANQLSLEDQAYLQRFLNR